MTLRDRYQAFLQVRLVSRVAELQTALAALVDDPPPHASRIDIELFPDDGLTEHPPIRIFVFGLDGHEITDAGGVSCSNDLLTAMEPVMSTEELDQFYLWEGEGEDRMVALQQPIDGVNVEALIAWIANAWHGLDLRGYRCPTAITVHDDPDTEVVLNP